AAGRAARRRDIGPALVLAVAVPEVRDVLLQVIEAVLLDRQAQVAGKAVDHFGMVRRGTELSCRDVVRGRFEPVRVASRGEQLLCLRQVVLVVLRVRAEVLALRVEPPALVNGGEGRVPARVYGQALGLELR